MAVATTRTTFSLSRWYVSFFPQPRDNHPFPAAKIRQTQTGDVAECRQIPKPSFGAGKRTPDVASPNDSQHHEIVRGRTENVAIHGICRNERVALVFASFSLKKKKKSFPVSHRTKRHPKSQRTKKVTKKKTHFPYPPRVSCDFLLLLYLCTQKKRRAPKEALLYFHQPIPAPSSVSS
ncbi:MAG: hypothetical protein J6K72_12205 [Clostridia bacterium]|nr:hypothetical protein [Clostridia bacterium]